MKASFTKGPSWDIPTGMGMWSMTKEASSMVARFPSVVVARTDPAVTAAPAASALVSIAGLALARLAFSQRDCVSACLPTDGFSWIT
jgi:hypothetical protein